MDEHEAQTLADIDRFGWSVFKVGNDMGPDFAYSVGMFRTLSHPEILIFGLPLDTMHRLINDVGERVRFVAAVGRLGAGLRRAGSCERRGCLDWLSSDLPRFADYAARPNCIICDEDSLIFPNSRFLSTLTLAHHPRSRNIAAGASCNCCASQHN